MSRLYPLFPATCSLFRHHRSERIADSKSASNGEGLRFGAGVGAIGWMRSSRFSTKHAHHIEHLLEINYHFRFYTSIKAGKEKLDSGLRMTSERHTSYFLRQLIWLPQAAHIFKTNLEAWLILGELQPPTFSSRVYSFSITLPGKVIRR